MEANTWAGLGRVRLGGQRIAKNLARGGAERVGRRTVCELRLQCPGTISIVPEISPVKQNFKVTLLKN